MVHGTRYPATTIQPQYDALCRTGASRSGSAHARARHGAAPSASRYAATARGNMAPTSP
jgi:hypothetical protein